MKRKLEEVVVNLSKANESSLSPNFDAPSPSSGSDLDLPDSVHSKAKTAESQPVQKKIKEKMSPMNMDLDSRITSFLAAGSQAIAVSLVITLVRFSLLISFVIGVIFIEFYNDRDFKRTNKQPRVAPTRRTVSVLS